MPMSTPTGTAGVTIPDGQNAFYIINITHSYQGTVFAWIPENFAMNITETWSYLIGAGTPTIANFFSTGMFGRVPMTQYLTQQVWSGGSPLRFGLPLNFSAKRDAAAEVVNPIKSLLKMALPESPSDTFLIPPGPNSWTGGFDITLSIGNYIRIPQLYIESVDVEFFGRMSTTGLPMQGKATVRFGTMYCPTAYDIDQWILPGGAAGAGAAAGGAVAV